MDDEGKALQVQGAASELRRPADVPVPGKSKKTYVAPRLEAQGHLRDITFAPTPVDFESGLGAPLGRSV